jgi:hypothetical protein
MSEILAATFVETFVGLAILEHGNYGIGILSLLVRGRHCMAIAVLDLRFAAVPHRERVVELGVIPGEAGAAHRPLAIVNDRGIIAMTTSSSIKVKASAAVRLGCEAWRTLRSGLFFISRIP